jgi:hypothetical protein
MVMVVDVDLAGVAMEVAVTVTIDPVGTADGAVYVTPLASALALKVPQAPGLPQVSDHVTKLFTELVGTEAGKVAAATSVAEA